MAVSNHERVGKMLELLTAGLKPFVERELKKGNPPNWFAETKHTLADSRLQLQGTPEAPHWDAAAILVTMWNKWNDVFRKTLGQNERTLVSELRETRNRWAHQRLFSVDDAYRALDSGKRLLTAVSATEADEVEKMKMELLRERFEDQVRIEKRWGAGTAIETHVRTELKPLREVVSGDHYQVSKSFKREFPSKQEVATAVGAADALYSEMNAALWCISKSVRADLVQHKATERLEALVWTIRSWWGLQGVKTETRRIAAKALAAMDWTDAMFAEKHMPDARQLTLDRVTEFLQRMNDQGVSRKEFSLATKVLHWLSPWQIVIYDSFARREVGISTSASPECAYKELVAWEFDAAERLSDGSLEWLGTSNPCSPIRSIDKYLWWIGGGNQGRSAKIKDPWRICRQLGLSRD